MSSADTLKSEYLVLHCDTAIASVSIGNQSSMHGLRRVTHLSRANFVELGQARADITLKPVKGLGRKIPVMLTTSPGLMVAT